MAVQLDCFDRTSTRLDPVSPEQRVHDGRILVGVDVLLAVDFPSPPHDGALVKFGHTFGGGRNGGASLSSLRSTIVR